MSGSVVLRLLGRKFLLALLGVVEKGCMGYGLVLCGRV